MEYDLHLITSGEHRTAATYRQALVLAADASVVGPSDDWQIFEIADPTRSGLGDRQIGGTGPYQGPLPV